MPKEIIYDEAELYDPAVAWRRDEGGNGYVQLGVETHDGRPLAAALAETEIAGKIDHAQFVGVWGTLDRAGCNRAIRALRRARDQAFGRDE